ncbi:MAG: TetR/AcrR family transcriptional regulator [Pseudomonadota bacterium]
MRKNAKQERAKQTVAAILEATTQLLARADIEQISTNHIAKRAGVSIGTLYQYFPNKTAIFIAIANRDIDHRVKLVAQAIAESGNGLAGASIRDLIRAFIKTFSNASHNAALIRVLMATRASAEARTLPVDVIAQLLATSTQQSAQSRALTETSAFVLTRAVLWTILTATIDAPHLLETQDFEDELVILVQSFLSADHIEA